METRVCLKYFVRDCSVIYLRDSTRLQGSADLASLQTLNEPLTIRIVGKTNRSQIIRLNEVLT